MEERSVAGNIGALRTMGYWVDHQRIYISRDIVVKIMNQVNMYNEGTDILSLMGESNRTSS